MPDDDTNNSNASSGASANNNPAPTGGYQPPSEGEWGKVQKALEKANNEAKGYRQRIKEMETGHTEAIETAKAAATSEAIDELTKERDSYKELALAGHISAALSEARAKNGSVVMRLVDRSKLEFETADDGTVTVKGLGDEIERVRKEAPELFTGRRMANPNARGDNKNVEDDKDTPTAVSAAHQMFKSGMGQT